MRRKAQDFIDAWIAENVHPTGYEPDGDYTEAKRLAVRCWHDCDVAGIGRPTVNEAVGDLVKYMAKAIRRVNDAEVQRLVNKDN